MTDSFTYNGTGKLSEALAELYGISPKNHNKIAELIKQAKKALAISNQARQMPTGTRLLIYRWHVERVHSNTNSVAIFKQAEQIEPIGLHQQADSERVETISHAEVVDAVDIITQLNDSQSVEIISQAPIHQSVELFSQTRIAFYVQKHGKRERQVIALEGYYLNALAVLGVNKAEVPKWVQAAVDNWIAFDPELPITRQVKYLIVSGLIDKAMG